MLILVTLAAMFLHHKGSKLPDAMKLKQCGYELEADRVLLGTEQAISLAGSAPGPRAGIYLWTARPGPAHEHEHVVYIGRTNNLVRRLKEYGRDFQPHSVNDFKLQVFQGWLRETFPGARLALYFRAVDADLPTAEKEAVRQFDPLLNQRLTMPEAAQSAFRRAFYDYYSAGFAGWVDQPKRPDQE